uniref:Uncharacterized protein n=1 Tax=Meloidogyne floridensis TaxID=298350 RepID=A0A915P4F4_9BILA
MVIVIARGKASHSSPPQEEPSVSKNVPKHSSKPSDLPMLSAPSTKPSDSVNQLVSLKEIDGHFKDSFVEEDTSNTEETSDNDKKIYMYF